MCKDKLVKNLLCLLLTLSTCVTGCGGHDANPVKVHQFGDENKSCDALKVEMYEIDEEITRLSPKADENGEKVEIDALRRRHSHLMRLAQQKNCKGLATK